MLYLLSVLNLKGGPFLHVAPFKCTKMWHEVVNNSFSGYCHNVASFVYIPAHVAPLPPFSHNCPFPDPSPLRLSSQRSHSPGLPFPCTCTSLPHQPITYTCTTSIGLQVVNICILFPAVICILTCLLFITSPPALLCPSGFVFLFGLPSWCWPLPASPFYESTLHTHYTVLAAINHCTLPVSPHLGPFPCFRAHNSCDRYWWQKTGRGWKGAGSFSSWQKWTVIQRRGKHKHTASNLTLDASLIDASPSCLLIKCVAKKRRKLSTNHKSPSCNKRNSFNVLMCQYIQHRDWRCILKCI